MCQILRLQKLLSNYFESFFKVHIFWEVWKSLPLNFNIIRKPEILGLGSRISGVEAFWYKTKIKIIYFVWLFVTLTLNFWYVKLKNGLIFFWGWRLFFWSHVIMQNICNKFIEIKFSVGLGMMLTITPIDSNSSIDGRIFGLLRISVLYKE